ncbi:hypothetical protein P5673_014722 [Acropora cervicornis]|uniref:Uncharacterized protein n=1 Tax=Acropora cervicornis TaxID=6130 RepID=A0AAD9QIJ0_ACRCE|nr:hypothetical protein P5673_014722 [Acropora cervicornis]
MERFHNAILKTCVMSAHMRKKHSNDVFQNQKLSFEVERIDYRGCIVTKKVAFVCKICHQCCLEHSSAVFISQNSSSYRRCAVFKVNCAASEGEEEERGLGRLSEIQLAFHSGTSLWRPSERVRPRFTGFHSSAGALGVPLWGCKLVDALQGELFGDEFLTGHTLADGTTLA